MDDHLVCSDFCEENGFPKAADWLRAASGCRRTAYVVMERGTEYDDCIDLPRAEGHPRTIFLDRGEAERAAALRNAAWHRENNVLKFCYDIKDVTDLSEAQLASAIGEILGRPIVLPPCGGRWYDETDEPIMKGRVTDEQMMRFAGLFTLKFFYVAETKFAEDSRDGRLF